MSFGEKIGRELRFLTGLVRTLMRVAPIKPMSLDLICDDLEAAVDEHRARPAITFEGRTVSYGELDALANQYAHWGQEQHLHRGSTVALFMPNRIDYLAIWYGLSKIGVATALINNQLTGPALAHCLNISNAAHCIVDDETAAAFEEVRATLAHPMQEWTLAEAHQGQRNLTQTLKSCSPLRPDRKLRDGLMARDTALYIYTSGTTGLPKAARITHMRAQLYMKGFAGSTGARADDRIYITLPLYHATGGLCAVGAALLNGGSVVLRRRFSASAFWEEAAAQKATMFVYIGELGRYLVNTPPSEHDRAHKIRLAFGNGLNRDVWAELEDRFAIPRVLEFYGSTEGNVSMFNFDGKLGAIGRMPKYLRGAFNVRLVKFDVATETPVRGSGGFCIEADVNEPGECLGQIHGDARSDYTGYADKAASEKKVAHDVFVKGDRWFRTGDLLRQDEEGYFYFVDRIGDTFRWKGENVSTGEVAAAVAKTAGVQEANVYGVAVGEMEGKAGMAAIVAGPGFDVAKLAAQVDEALPAYARPLFVRKLPQLATTGTFKVRKVDLVNDGFDPAKVTGELWFREPEGGYAPLTAEVYAKILAGEYRL